MLLLLVALITVAGFETSVQVGDLCVDALATLAREGLRIEQAVPLPDAPGPDGSGISYTLTSDEARSIHRGHRIRYAILNCQLTFAVAGQGIGNAAAAAAAAAAGATGSLVPGDLPLLPEAALD